MTAAERVAAADSEGAETLTETTSFDLRALGGIVGFLMVAWGGVLGALPLNDNSFFTHLATGRIILDEGSVPTVDPFTFSASGTTWTVQSWLASVAYAGAEQIGGAAGLRLLIVGIFCVAAALVWRLSEPAQSVVPRLVIVALAMVGASGMWSERPYMVGIIGLALVWLALDGAVPAWSLAPLLWVWANAHGSYPMAFALIAAVLAGRWLDGRTSPSEGIRERHLHVAAAAAIGNALAVISPLGFRVLWFPVEAVTNMGAFGEIVEWQAPDFRSADERAFLLLVVLTIVGLTTLRWWRFTLPSVVFIAAGLIAQRNMAMATIVLIPIVAEAAPQLGSLRSATRPAFASLFAVLAVACFAATPLLALALPTTNLGGYPLEALAWTESAEPGRGQLLTQDYAGNLLEVLNGSAAQVFIDDRVDMFPAAVVDDYLTLVHGEPSWDAVLERHEIGTVLWDRTQPLGSLLASHPGWKVVYSDTRWIVAERRIPDH